MNLYSWTLSAVLLLVTVACNDNRNELPKKNDIFKNYLANKLNIRIKQNHTYIVIPDLGCGSCITSSLLYISQKKHCKNTSLVVSRSIKRVSPADIKMIENAVEEVIADTTFDGINTLDRTQLPFKSFTGVIESKNNELKYTSFDNTNYKSVIDKTFCNN